MDDDLLDGCDLDFTDAPTSDDDLDGVVLFADVSDDPAAIEERRAEWQELLADAP